ncbi:hypothetical protein ACOME3_003027 [Neoechinorhynchus agilis]
MNKPLISYAMDTMQLMTSPHTAETTTAAPARFARRQAGEHSRRCDLQIAKAQCGTCQRTFEPLSSGLVSSHGKRNSRCPGSGKPSLLLDQQAIISKPLDVEYLDIHIDRLAHDANIEFNAALDSQQQAPYVPTSCCSVCKGSSLTPHSYQSSPRSQNTDFDFIHKMLLQNILKRKLRLNTLLF